jgi:hypothetical protein
VPAHFAGLLSNFVLNPILRPVLRLLTGLGAIPLFRFIVRRLFRVQTTTAELERDLELWFRGAVLMLAATANMESFLFGWTPWYQQSGETVWQTLILRLLLAVGVIESMPDEDVFSILHRGPPKLKLTRAAGWREAWRRRKEIVRGLGILHLRRSTPVFAIMAVIFGGETTLSAEITELHKTVGWWCYGLAITQYLIIALITQRDRIAGLLESFDREASAIRLEMVVGAASSAVVTDDDDANDANIHPRRYE